VPVQGRALLGQLERLERAREPRRADQHLRRIVRGLPRDELVRLVGVLGRVEVGMEAQVDPLRRRILTDPDVVALRRLRPAGAARGWSS
jgi:hypothetical protein